MGVRQKKIERLRKLRELAEKGVGGEKTGAQRKYEELKEAYKITEEEIDAVQQLPEQPPTFAEVAIKMQLEDEFLFCWKECPAGKGSQECENCSTKENIKELGRQLEQLKERREGQNVR